MSDRINPIDRIAALEWAVKKAEEPSKNPLARFNLFVLRALLEEALREARA